MNALIYVLTTTVGHLYFTNIDSMFEYINTHDDVVSGYVGVEP